MTYSAFFTTQDMFDLLNSSFTEFYDVLITAFQNYFVKDPPYEITLSPGTSMYDLPTDFYKSILMEELLSPNQSNVLFPFNELERNSIISTDTAAIPFTTVRMRYIPAPPTFTDLLETIDGISGWDELIVTDMAIAMLESEESDTSALDRRKQRLLTRIQSNAQNRDITMPSVVTDITPQALGLVQNTLQYRFYGNKVQFISITYLGV